MVRQLIFRCSHCRATTKAQVEWPGTEPVEVECSVCKSVFLLAADRDRGATDEEYREKIRKFALANNMELPSACSVLEGIMPMEKVRRLPAGPPAAKQGPVPPLRSLVLLIALLIGVGMLANQLKNRRKPSLPAARPGAAAVLAGSIPPNNVLPDPAPEAQVAPSVLVPIVYQVDGEGRLTKVAGPDPQSVLAGFCGFDTNAPLLAAYALAEALPPDPGARLGLVRNRENLSELRSVRIWLDPRTGRWSIGNGKEPVPMVQVAAAPDRLVHVF